MKVFLVGGAVRDSLMGLPVNDRDWVVVGTTPQEMLDAGFSQVGASFPVFLHSETGEEWALARTERKTGVGYTGFDFDTESVTLEDDLSRRDLTINAVAFDPETQEYVDPFGGMKDIEAGVLRHVSPAFAEDPLRVVRLARFYARYKFDVALETFDLATKVVLSGEMDSLPDERYVKEFEKVFSDPTADAGYFFEFLHSVGVFQHVDFFKRTFQHRHLHFVRVMSAFAKKASHLSADEMMVASFLGSVTDASTLKKFGSEVSEAFGTAQSLMKVFTNTMTAEKVVQTLKMARSTRGPSAHMSSALRVLRAVQEGSVLPEVTADMWEEFMGATASVDTLSLVERFKGKELGEQINKAMVEAVAKVMK